MSTNWVPKSTDDDDNDNIHHNNDHECDIDGCNGSDEEVNDYDGYDVDGEKTMILMKTKMIVIIIIM